MWFIHKEPPVCELEALRKDRKTSKSAMQDYVMFCLCTELKICCEVMCKRIFANIRELVARFTKVFLQSTVNKFLKIKHVQNNTV